MTRFLRITSIADAERRRLHGYIYSNRENTAFFCPDIKDPEEARRKVEEGFLEYLENDFLKKEGNSICVLEESGIWQSALRLNCIRESFYYIETIETRPGSRRKGYASRLLGALIDDLKKGGSFTLVDSVANTNTASLNTHLATGFRIAGDEGYDYLQNTRDTRDYPMECSFIR